MGILIQIISTVLLSLSCINIGITYNWPSSTILLFKSENTTLNRPMTNMDVNLFSSLPLVGCLIGQPMIILGVLPRLGLKFTTVVTSLLFVISWSLIAISDKVETVLIAVFLSGCGYGIYLETTMYISEIAQDTLRGTLISGPNIAVGVGLVMSYLLGGVLEYKVMVYSCLSLTVIGTLAILFLKDSPVSLMVRGREEDAAESLAYYRQLSVTSKEVYTEINNIRLSLSPKSEEVQSLTQVPNEEQQTMDSKKTCWELFKSTPSIRRQLYLALVLQTAYVFTGLPSVQVYAEPIFTTVMGESMSPDLFTVTLGIVILVSGLVTAYLVDTIGRRPLQIYASVVCGVTCACLGAQMITEWLPNWTVLAFIYILGIAHTMGSGTIPFIVVAEIFVPEVKSKLCLITTEWSYLWCFTCMFVFSAIVQTFGYAPMFIMFSISCFAASVYFFYYLPETMGLPVYEIQELFVRRVRN